ncbi:MAG: DUF6142 family protein [Lachnospiraceae bacterium]|nr:DUF6142 family protein [Lachnospiraceae bacterium]
MVLRRKSRNKSKAKFSGRKQSKRAIAGLVLVALALISLLVSINLAFIQEGKAGTLIGSLGLASLIFAVVGLVMEILSLKEEDVYKLIPIVGTVLGALTGASWLAIYIVGIVI